MTLLMGQIVAGDCPLWQRHGTELAHSQAGQFLRKRWWWSYGTSIYYLVALRSEKKNDFHFFPPFARFTLNNRSELLHSCKWLALSITDPIVFVRFQFFQVRVEVDLFGWLEWLWNRADFYDSHYLLPMTTSPKSKGIFWWLVKETLTRGQIWRTFLSFPLDPIRLFGSPFSSVILLFCVLLMRGNFHHLSSSQWVSGFGTWDQAQRFLEQNNLDTHLPIWTCSSSILKFPTKLSGMGWFSWSVAKFKWVNHAFRWDDQICGPKKSKNLP